MANYINDWQPQRLNGIPGSPFFDAGHAGAKGHNHLGFKTKEQAAEMVKFLRGQGIQITEWAGDQGANIGGHQDPGHSDGRSFDVPASQWSPDKPDSKKEIAGMARVETLLDDFLGTKGVPESARPYRTRKPAGRTGTGRTGTYGATIAEPITSSVIEPAKPAPQAPAPQAPAPEAPAQPAMKEIERQVVSDWKPAASDAGRSTDPSSQAYWQRQDMKIWAQANPELAKQTMARAGADPAWLEKPATETIKETVPVAQAPTPPAPAPTPTPTPAPQAQTPQAQTPQAQTPTTAKPPDRGALNGTQVGGTPPIALQPYSFEIHADQPTASGGHSGFLGSYLDKDNPLFQRLNSTYGNYGPNNSRDWRGGDLGALKRGLSIIETRAGGDGMNDPKQHVAAAEKLYQTFMADPEVKAGKRQINLFAGHLDVDPKETNKRGTAGETDWNLGVFNALRQRVQQDGRTNFRFFDPIVAGDSDPNANWNRAKALRDQWINRKQGGKP